jgi:carbonic anhydrase/acetyltransferase-like protein (isoleucine patch superfamily)
MINGSMSDLEEPLRFLRRVLTKTATIWMRCTYGFWQFGDGTSVDYSCDISKRIARRVSLGTGVYVAPDVWLNVPPDSPGAEPAIILSHGCQIGRRSMISARNLIHLEEDVLLAPSVLLMDHNHEYSSVDRPIHSQGTTSGGKITIGKNCWLGYNSVIFCGSGHLILGQNSVVGANSVVTCSFPPYSVIAGNPAKLIRSFDDSTRSWMRVTR